MLSSVCYLVCLRDACYALALILLACGTTHARLFSCHSEPCVLYALRSAAAAHLVCRLSVRITSSSRNIDYSIQCVTTASEPQVRPLDRVALSFIRSLAVCHTAAQSCYSLIGDNPFLWNNGKFDPPQLCTPSIDYYQTRHD